MHAGPMFLAVGVGEDDPSFAASRSWSPREHHAVQKVASPLVSRTAADRPETEQSVVKKKAARAPSG